MRRSPTGCDQRGPISCCTPRGRNGSERYRSSSSAGSPSRDATEELLCITRPPPVIRSSLDRNSLVQIAVAGGGDYFEIGDEPDRLVAFRIVDRLRRQAPPAEPVETVEELYKRVLIAAAVVLCVGGLFVRKPVELVWHAAGAGAAAILLFSLMSA